ncbi:MAG: lysylphosphatidylglycerol synthase transmembrane domain-containing protein [Victivallaceae bacterium]|nr:lysylphosphatidylglycerol synthase transmembrane domain-containing protein [Victivallaceae bacterium]
MAETDKTSGTVKKIFWFILRISLAGGIIYWLISANSDSIKTGFSNIGENWGWLIPATLLYGFHMMVCAWRWKKLAEIVHIKITMLEATSLTMKGYFFSLVLPGGAIGGDIAKIGFMASRSDRGTKVEGAFSILMDRITGMAALFATAIVVIILSIPSLMKIELTGSGLVLDDFWRILIIIGLLGLCCSGIIAMFAVFNHRVLEKITLVKSLMDWLDGKTDGAVTRMCTATDLYKDSWHMVLFLSLIGIVFIHLILVVVVFFLMKAIGLEGFSIMGVATAVVVANIAGLIPFTPGGVGIRDLTMRELLVVAGAGTASAVVPILFTSILIAFNLLAGLFFIFDSGKKTKTPTMD